MSKPSSDNNTCGSCRFFVRPWLVGSRSYCLRCPPIREFSVYEHSAACWQYEAGEGPAKKDVVVEGLEYHFRRNDD